jgi:hypothetical protein
MEGRKDGRKEERKKKGRKLTRRSGGQGPPVRKKPVSET